MDATLPRLAVLLTMILALPGCLDTTPTDPPAAMAEGDSTESPYVGEEAREIKALSSQEVADLLAGKGMGYAKAAELNSWPGPAHVLELVDELALTEAQRADVERVRQEMLDEVTPLGRALVDAEAALDEAFASRDVDADRVDALVREAARVEGELRAAHLRAHLTTTWLLTHEQVQQYDELRGYGASEDGAQPHAHDQMDH